MTKWTISPEGDGPENIDRLFFRLRRMLMEAIREHGSYPHLPATHSAEDVLQELWTSAFEPGSLQRFHSQGRGSLYMYLCRCLDKTILSIIRGEDLPETEAEETPANSDGYDLGLVQPLPPHRPEAPPRAGGGDDWGEWVRRCQELLEGADRQVWTLRFVDDSSYRQIAEKLKISESATRAAYHRAITKLYDSGMMDEEQDARCTTMTPS